MWRKLKEFDYFTICTPYRPVFDYKTGFKRKVVNAVWQVCLPFQRLIDYLKLDVEFNEWPALYEMISSGTIHRVRQMALEVHSPEMDIHTQPEHHCTHSTVESLQFMFKVSQRWQYRLLSILLTPCYVHPPGGWIYYFCFFRRPMSDVRCPASGVRCPASRMVSAHLKEKY